MSRESGLIHGGVLGKSHPEIGSEDPVCRGTFTQPPPKKPPRERRGGNNGALSGSDVCLMVGPIR